MEIARQGQTSSDKPRSGVMHPVIHAHARDRSRIDTCVSTLNICIYILAVGALVICIFVAIGLEIWGHAAGL